MWCARCSRGRRTRSEAAAESRLQAQRLRDEADHIEQQLGQQEQLDQDEQDEQGAERAERAWARFAAHLRRLARLRRIWAFLGHYLREIANRRGEPRRRRR